MISDITFSELQPATIYESERYEAVITHTRFRPIGYYVEEEYEDKDVRVIYYPKDDEKPDPTWMAKVFPKSADELIDVFNTALAQYCGEGWCGEDMREEIIEELSEGGFFEDTERLKVFTEKGYPPFILVQTIIFDRYRNRLIIEGHTDIDYNLDEHGIAVKIDEKGIEFNYSAEFKVGRIN
ncbi:hypothetical protein SAMN02745181_0308 [Rubritalea squalenifaciens DSM 18772]|uniref:Uncharacterized protein n=1 Tax=Rubritalea squalenifaciens DSM 18772 TaxID=1123071 RepID=A0A1M6BTS0_9BACT|nr:hypothetical protein [Rubritalea squalenifaciens]SHI52182.1 hypothetical protein SAMN02745181_0308 [Rubritalea squalenifaciens DSM 18772]